ncbi:MAG: glycosyltransferase family 4 protein [Thermoleophilaceae bacterium]
MSEPRVLVLHNRYRHEGGEERAVDLQLAAFRRAGITHAPLVRDSGEAARARAGAALLRGGERPGDVAAAVRAIEANVVHVHNMNPLFGPRSLRAARDAGARVVLHLHNFRLFCSIAVAFRDGATCFRCSRRFTLPGLVLNCRGSLPESAAYSTALALHQPAVLDAVDRFVTPSRFAAEQLTRLGLPAERLEVIPNYVPEAAPASPADGGYALMAGRLSVEKGAGVAVGAALQSGVPLRVVGDGPLAPELLALVDGGDAPVELLGRVPAERVARLLAGAAMAVVPSVGPEVMPYAALEAMAAGVPVVASDTGSLPEILGPDRCVARRDAGALGAAMQRLWEDPDLCAREGRALRERVRERYSEERHVRDLRALYERVQTQA